MLEFDLSSLETSNLIAVMNKLNPLSFARLRQTSKSVNEFAEQHKQLLGIAMENEIKIFYRGILHLELYNKHWKYYNMSEAMFTFSGFSFRNISLDGVDFTSIMKNSERLDELLKFLKSRIWRKTYLSQEGVLREILVIIKPFWLFTIIPVNKFQDESYVQWMDIITSIPQINRLVYGVVDYRGPKILKLALQKWCSSSLGNLNYVVPGMNFTFCNVEGWKIFDMLETIKKRHLTKTFETIEVFLSKKQYQTITEVYEENQLPEERFTENIVPQYKPVGIIKIKCNKDGKNACLAVEVTQYGEKEFNVAFCLYTNKESVEYYEKRMKELLISE